MFNILTDHLSFHSFAFISQEPTKASRQQPKKFIIPYSVHKYFFLQKYPNSWHDREAFGRNNKICILMRCTFAVPANSKADDLYLSVLYYALMHDRMEKWTNMRMNKGVSKVKHKEPKASQAHVSRKRKWLIYESRTCWEEQLRTRTGYRE